MAGNFRHRNSYGRKRTRVRLLLNTFTFCLITAGLWFICLNVTPYIKFVNYFSQQMFSFDKSLVSEGILLIFGVCFWAIIQFLQLFPILLFSSEKFMKSLIDRSEDRQKVFVKTSDEPIVGKLKTAYNALPTSFVANLEKWCVISYILDFYINCTINPPIKGGFDLLGDMLLYGRFELLNWTNILLTLQTIFAVEFVVLMLIWSFSLLTVLNDNV
jgi:hypothetical protein